MKKVFLTLLLVFSFAITNAQSITNTKEINPNLVLASFIQNPQNFGLNNWQVKGCKIASFISEKQTGIKHLYLQQFANDLPVVNGVYGLHYSSNGQLMVKTNSFSPFTGVFENNNLSALSPEEAVFSVLKKISSTSSIADLTKINPLTPGYLEENKFYYYSCAYNYNGILLKAISFIYADPAAKDWLHIILNIDGSELERINWTLHCNHDHSAKNNKENRSTINVYPKSDQTFAAAAFKENSSYRAYNFDVESPLHGKRLLLNNINDTLASPFGWHDEDGVAGPEYTITRGNNVYAYDDQAAKNIAGYSPDGGTGLTFDFTIDPYEINPANYLDAAITNLFVINNLMHDVTYHYGFDEAAGNFQKTNYSGSGASNDFVKAEAQDGSGTNNANFSTLPDGSAPRMQMYIWNDKSGSTLGPRIWNVTPAGGSHAVGVAQFGAGLNINPIEDTLIWVNDGGIKNGIKGCKTLSLTKNKKIKGNIALIERGGCTFEEKVWYAQQAGAKAVVILDTSAVDVLVNMSGSNTYAVSIPSVFVKYSDVGEYSENMASGTVVVKLVDSSAVLPNTDSDLDQNVIAHEYTHGISNRLTCGPTNTSALNNAEQMGEGWSDYVALALTAKSTDVGSKPRAIGNWLTSENLNGGGIRTFPYSTNMAINSHTYKNIIKNSSGGRTEVHYLGEVWCAMLWDLHWKMIEKYGYDANRYTGTGGNNKCMQLVFLGMKLQKCSPGFVDGRNAILQADSLLYGGANNGLIWGAFARCGLGYSAKQGASTSTADGNEAFDLPPVPSNSVKQIEKTVFSIVPNPAHSSILFQPLKAKQVSEIEILDASGRIVLAEMKDLGFGAYRINISNLNPGIYIITAKCDGALVSSKFVKR